MSEKCPNCGEQLIEYASVGLPCLNCMYTPNREKHENIEIMCWEQRGNCSSCCIRRLTEADNE